mgnify:CR=1 FL=1
MYLIFMVFLFFKKGIKEKDQQKMLVFLQEMLFYFFSGVQPLGRS